MIDVDDALRRLSATLTQERFTGPEWIFEGKLDGIYRGITKAVADKGYHSNQVMVDLEAIGVRSYISEPDRGQRNWKDTPRRVAPCGARARPLVERRRRPGTDRDLTARRMVSAFFVQVKRRAALLQCWR